MTLRRRDPAVVELEKKALRHQAKKAKESDEVAPTSSDAPVPAGALPTATEREEGETLTGRAVHQYARSGPRNQPKRAPKSKR